MKELKAIFVNDNTGLKWEVDGLISIEFSDASILVTWDDGDYNGQFVRYNEFTQLIIKEG